MLSKILFLGVLFIFIKNLIKLVKIQNSMNAGPRDPNKKANPSNVFDAEYTVIKEENS